MRVLVADEDIQSRYMILETLAAAHLELLSATNGEEAWERLKGNDPPRLVILSWSLPELDGLEISEKIRRAQARDYTYVVLLSTKNGKAAMLTAFEAGVDDYVAKPVSREEILARVQVARRFLEREDRLSIITQQWRTMIDSLPFGLACLGREGEIRRVNKVFVEQLGLDLRSIIGKSLRPAILHRIEDYRLLLDNMRRSQDFNSLEMQMMHGDGKPRRVIVWGRPVERTGELRFQIITAVQP
jgi:PAS domain S-box-containing protein